MCGLPLVKDPNVLVGLDPPGDAGVYKLGEGLAIIQTVDLITPIVDDAFTFGRIAAANSISDIYAMGGKPLTALNILCFPIKTLPVGVARDVLRGGVETMKEAGVALLGGHSIDDAEMKYGLCVTGSIDPGRILTKGGIKPGDALVLTKPLGTGVISTALKAGKASRESAAAIAASMTALNKTAAEIMLKTGANACTDITGFGFLGHAFEMAEQSGVALEIDWEGVPLFPEALDYARAGFIPGGAKRNRDFRRKQLQFPPSLPDFALDVLFDPQTSGGLLISLPAPKAKRMADRLHEAGLKEAAIVGRALAGSPGKIFIK